MAGHTFDSAVDNEARERQAEEQFVADHCSNVIERTRTQTEIELLEASHRFLRQFSLNPFAGTKMKGHAVGAASGKEQSAAGADAQKQVAATVDEASTDADINHVSSSSGTQAPNTTPVATRVATPVATTPERETNVAESPVKIITEKAPFKFNPEAKEFVPDSNLVVTPWGILPRNKALLPHQRDSVEPYDPKTNEGYHEFYTHLMDGFHSQDKDASRWD
ncbi:hypothetical protein SUNI508_07458 [Seiridium unicorne]|uniref:Uncharacterized protein n=1 Tax=Seiridium unicorne TaxID=138068 RepID=A0ABR2UXR9_9PEZI